MTDVSLCQFYTQAPPTTMLPLTPKIGMGKPAISKRKFSPGRARVKQVCEPVSSAGAFTVDWQNWCVEQYEFILTYNQSLYVSYIKTSLFTLKNSLSPIID